MQTIKLKQPMIIKGKEESKIVLDFEQIRGKDLIAAEKEVRAMGDTTPSVFLSMNFQAVVAAKLLGVPVEDLQELPATDFRNIVVPVANFLLS